MRRTSVHTRVVAWLSLGCHLLVASGLPVATTPAGGREPTAARPAKDRSRPFPCMNTPCGCATAEQCFANCCCHTPAQRLAWARAHRVDAAIVAALERRVAAAAPPAATCSAAARQHEPSCCAATSCCGAKAAPEPASCAAETSVAATAPAEPTDSEPADGEPADAEPDDATGPRVVILRDALACGGILTAWLACGTALPAPPQVAAPADCDRSGFIAIDDVVAPSVSADRTVPPPRVG